MKNIELTKSFSFFTIKKNKNVLEFKIFDLTICYKCIYIYITLAKKRKTIYFFVQMSFYVYNSYMVTLYDIIYLKMIDRGECFKFSDVLITNNPSS